jgi:hypothetical protein
MDKKGGTQGQMVSTSPGAQKASNNTPPASTERHKNPAIKPASGAAMKGCKYK